MAGLPTKNTLISQPLFDNIGRPGIATLGAVYEKQLREEFELEYIKKAQEIRVECDERIKEIEEYYSGLENGGLGGHKKFDLIVSFLEDLVWHKDFSLKARMKSLPIDLKEVKPILKAIGEYMQAYSSQINNNNRGNYKKKTRELIALSEQLLGLKKHSILVKKVSAGELASVKKEMKDEEAISVPKKEVIKREEVKPVSKVRLPKEEEFKPDPTDFLKNS